jgi:hypothetical protein
VGKATHSWALHSNGDQKNLVLPLISLLQTVVKQSGLGISKMLLVSLNPKDPRVNYNTFGMYRNVKDLYLNIEIASK